MTEYEIHRTAEAVVDLLLSDDRFFKRMEKLAPRKSRLLKTAQAAERLGLSKDTLRSIAPYIGGISSGEGPGTRWSFEEDTLKENYLAYINSK